MTKRNVTSEPHVDKMYNRFEVVHRLCNGEWVNMWTDDDEPVRFNTIQEARAALDDYFAEQLAHIRAGAIDAEYSAHRREEYRIYNRKRNVYLDVYVKEYDDVRGGSGYRS